MYARAATCRNVGSIVDEHAGVITARYIKERLYKSGDKGSLPIAVEALKSSSRTVRYFAALQLSGLGVTAGRPAIPVLQRIVAPHDPDFDELAAPDKPQALVVCPTRELALQVSDDFAVAGAKRGTRTVTVYGGVPYDEQVKGLTAGVDVVVGTPGRLLDLSDRGTLDLFDRHLELLENDAAAKLRGYDATMNWNSPQQVADWFFKRLKLKPPKLTDTGAESTDKDVLKELALLHPSAEALKMERYCSSLRCSSRSRWRRSLMSRTAASACGRPRCWKGMIRRSASKVLPSGRSTVVSTCVVSPASARRTMSMRRRT